MCKDTFVWATDVDVLKCIVLLNGFARELCFISACRILVTECTLWFDAVLVHQQPAYYWATGMFGPYLLDASGPVQMLARGSAVQRSCIAETWVNFLQCGADKELFWEACFLSMHTCCHCWFCCTPWAAALCPQQIVLLCKRVFEEV